jgi:hypothetical protein
MRSPIGRRINGSRSRSRRLASDASGFSPPDTPTEAIDAQAPLDMRGSVSAVSTLERDACARPSGTALKHGRFSVTPDVSFGRDTSPSWPCRAAL